MSMVSGHPPRKTTPVVSDALNDRTWPKLPDEVHPPRAGEVWEHFKGGQYLVVGIAGGQGTGVEAKRFVVYTPLNEQRKMDGPLYVRPLEEWHFKLTPSHNGGVGDNVAQPRFTKLAQQPCTCHTKPPSQNGFWDPACPQHGIDSPSHKEAMERLDRDKAEREERPSQDLWGGMDTSDA